MWNNFCCLESIVFLFESAQNVCFTFLKSHFKLEILMFLSIMVSFLFYIFKLKVVFLKKKHPRWNLRHIFVKKLLKFNMAKYLKKILLLTEFCKFIRIEKLHCYCWQGCTFNNIKSLTIFIWRAKFNKKSLLLYKIIFFCKYYWIYKLSLLI